MMIFMQIENDNDYEIDVLTCFLNIIINDVSVVIITIITQ